MSAEGIIDDMLTHRDRWTSEHRDLQIDAVRIERTAGQHHAWATVGDEERVVTSWYPDELTFTVADFDGLTISEAWALHSKRDIAWLRS